MIGDDHDFLNARERRWLVYGGEWKVTVGGIVEATGGAYSMEGGEGSKCSASFNRNVIMGQRVGYVVHEQYTMVHKNAAFGTQIVNMVERVEHDT